MRGWILVGLLGCVGAGAPGLASAADLEAHGPAECADASELSFRVQRSIGMPLEQAAPLAFDVEMEHAGAGYQAVIRVVDSSAGGETKQRVLTADDCAKLADAVGVAVALALGADPAEPPHAEAEVSAHAAAATTEPPLAATDAGAAPAATDPEPGGWRPSLSAWVLGDAGSLPSPSLGAALGVELGWRRLQLRALGTLLFEQHTEVVSALSPAPGARLELMTGALLACTLPFGAPASALHGLVCLGMEVGRLSGVGTDVASPRRGSALWAAPRLDVGALWTVPGSPLGLGVTVSAAAPLNRDEFALSGIGTVHQPPSVVGRLSIGIEIGFD
jgi:hypothetical protein